MAAAYGVLPQVKKAARVSTLRWAIGARAATGKNAVLLAGLILGMVFCSVRFSGAAPIRLLVLGDSLSAGYGLPHSQGFEPRLAAALRQHGEDVTIVDGAVSGDTSADGRARLDWVLAGGVDAAIVELGANDGLRGLDPTEMAANLSAILDTLAARHIPVLFAGMYAPPNLGPAYERAFRAVFNRLGKRSGLIYDPFFLQGVAEVPDLIQPDGLHPNAAGVRKIVQRILPLVQRLLAEVRKP